MTDNDTQTTVELWVRSFAPTVTSEKHERALECVNRLEDRSGVESVSVRVWGRAFERTERARRIPHLEEIATTIERFETWADRTGRSLEPFFRTRHVESKITGDAADVCRLPTLALAEYRGETLSHLAPSMEDERTVTVLDRLEALLSGEIEPAPTDERVPSFGDRSEEPTERSRKRLESSQ